MRALASVQLGDGGQWQHYVLMPDGKAQRIGRYEDRVIGGAVIAKNGTVFGVSASTRQWARSSALPRLTPEASRRRR